MSRRDSHRQFGLIGIGLIILAIVFWAFILPRFQNKDPSNLPAGITDKTQWEQPPPSMPTTEPPRPAIPAQ